MTMVQLPDEDHEPLRGGSPQAPERARNVTRGFLAVLTPADDSEANAVLLVVSELVTNAVRHAGGLTGFELKAGPGTVTVIVADASPTPPRPRRTDVSEPGGFGWYLVRDLSADVRVRSSPKGKTVTAVLPLAR
ncbi:ATP-binding protein [Streptomyces capitiformicae]|uniref:Histidine kinase/HSP90-like ATPase domain-containing protein n=1 Tax=Streptomyces capitiformicae TaxID=2014920 RepID=A0A919DNM1_9ACTN|nr:ATP-binding protein [Streptomyces capitiformicae]GHE60353.1 hypothetical protein GCM10017771_83590 [Streptomyces capitiformicae]